MRSISIPWALLSSAPYWALADVVAMMAAIVVRNNIRMFVPPVLHYMLQPKLCSIFVFAASL
jgi:hypothetical protein